MGSLFRLTLSVMVVALLLVSVGPPSAMADDVSPEKTVTEELLDILRQVGTIDEDQYQSLKRRARQEEQERSHSKVVRGRGVRSERTVLGCHHEISSTKRFATDDLRLAAARRVAARTFKISR